ncbi:MAG: glycosyltransferase family 4 protein, partial [Muribaculaceae bacterium]|nr:glycosyltransferase family 4 protein [Muribaculaceae bacterium]
MITNETTPTMIIGYDAKRAVLNRAGQGSYSRFLIELMAQKYPRNQYFMYTPRVKGERELTALLVHPNIHLKTPRKAIIKSWWRIHKGVVKDACRHHVEVYHGLSGSLPLAIGKSKIKSVVTIHDVAFKRFPQYFSWSERKLMDFKTSKSCSNADLIIATSECTKRDLIEFYGIDEQKIEVVYQCCFDCFNEPMSKAKLADIRRKYRMPSHYIIGMGNIVERKNIMAIVDAMRHIDDKDIKLVLVGPHTKYYDQLRKFAEENGLKGRLVRLSHVKAADLPGIYQMATLSVYMSHYEGFGLPILEAMSCGTPVIAATGSSLEEVGGDAAIYVAPDDHEGLAQAINKIIADEKYRELLIQKGKENIKRFDKN